MTPVEKLNELKSYFESLYHEEDVPYMRNIYKHKIETIESCIRVIS